MDAGDAVVPQILYLSGGVFYAQLPHCVIVGGVLVKLPVQFRWDGGPAEGGEPPYLGGVQNGQDAGDDGDVDSGPFRPLQKVKEVAVVVEKLGDEKVGALLHFSKA